MKIFKKSFDKYLNGVLYLRCKEVQMKLKRVVDLPTITEAKRIYARLKKGTMTYYEDNYGYAMFDEEELAKYVPCKSGRPSKNKRG